ncbi:hypothetical protein J2T13_000971 [Paenibacillus sp. DS2015]|uniref:hypothetical protein n=1 Tax=Paenibacillus sp. DS2015 TaxID=3373917 RepID=UPI003D231D7C
MSQKKVMEYQYYDFLKYHLLMILIPMLLIIVLYFESIVSVVSDIYRFYRVLFGEDDSKPLILFLIILKKLIKLGLSTFLLFLIAKVIKTGLYFLPYLALKGRPTLTFIKIVKIGIRNIIPVFMVTFAGGILISAVSSFVLLIPILNVFSFLVVPFLLALMTVLYDYAFSINQLHGKPIYYDLHRHFYDLYMEDKRFLLYATLLALSYFVMGAVLVRPFIQMQITKRLENVSKHSMNDVPYVMSF